MVYRAVRLTFRRSIEEDNVTMRSGGGLLLKVDAQSLTARISAAFSSDAASQLQIRFVRPTCRCGGRYVFVGKYETVPLMLALCCARSIRIAYHSVLQERDVIIEVDEQVLAGLYVACELHVST